MEQTFSFILAYVGMAIMLTLTCVGSAMGVTIAGNATISSIKRNPDIFGRSMLLCAMPSTQGIYGFAAFFVLMNALKGMDVLSVASASAVFAASISLAFGGLYSAIRQGKLLANGITEMAGGQDTFSKSLILAAFPELYAILPFAITFLVIPS